MPTLTVSRGRGWFDRFRKYRIWLDGKEIGSLGEDEKISLPIPQGTHVIEARIDWCGSPHLHVTVGDENVAIVVRNPLRGFEILLALHCALFNRSGYLTLELEQ